MKRAALVVIGAYLCGVGAFAHRHTSDAGGVLWPWGLVLTIVVTFAVVVAAARFTHIGGAWLGLGWALGMLGQQLSPGGSYLIASDWLGWSFTAGCLGVIVVGALRAPTLER